MQTKINSFQLYCILLTSRLLGTFTYMISLHKNLSTAAQIAVMLMYFVLSLIMSAPVFYILHNKSNTAFLQQIASVSVASRRIIAGLYCAVFLLSATITLIRFSLFTGTVLLQNTSLHIFIFSLMIVSIYAAHKGLQPLARTAVLFAFILCASLFFVQAGVLNEFKLLNISGIKASHISDIVKQAFFSASRNIEIPAVLFIADKISGNINKAIFRMLAVFSAATAILFAVAGGVTGAYGEQQMFPLFTLASVAKLGFFERMEDLLTGIWVVCAMIKITFLIIVATVCLRDARKKDSDLVTITALCGIAFAGYWFFSADLTKAINLLHSPLLPAGFIFFGVVFPTFLYLLAEKKGQISFKEKQW